MTAAAPTPSDRLLQAISSHLGALSNVVVQSGDWASATYIGMRHRLWFDAPTGMMTDGFLAGLHEIDLAMPGHFVADIDVIDRHDCADGVRIGLAALTIAED